MPLEGKVPSAQELRRMQALDTRLEKYDQLEVERRVREWWEANSIPQRLAEKRKGKKKFFLLDGPPYVNAEPHVGHVKTTACKDIWSRWKYMQGFDSVFIPGFDCHGLPVEVIVEKELGITSKADIERMGIEKFDELCLQKILGNEKLWLEYYRLLGAWRAYFTPYYTYKDYYIESGWWTVKHLHEKGFLTRGEKPVFWCPHCETVLSGYEVSDSYKEVTDPSVYLKFKIRGSQNEFLIVWTTTPWTLPGNVAIAAHPEEYYVKVKAKIPVKSDKKGASAEEIYVLGEKRLQAVMQDAGVKEYEVLERFKGERLAGMAYEPLLDVEQQRELKANDKALCVYLSIPIMKYKKYKKHRMKKEAEDEEVEEEKATIRRGGEEKEAEEKPEFEEFVTLEDGSGLVHCAPGHGASDYFFGEHYGLPAVSPVDERGAFTDKVSAWKGKFVKDADKEIIERLQREGKLLNQSRITHSYPLCWRCKSPLIYRLSKQWYLKIDTIHDKLLAANEGIEWMPSFGRAAFANWLAESGDWCISRQLYWAIPLPIWVCEKCGNYEVIGSVAELREKSLEKILEQEPKDLHRHVVDKIRLKCLCGGVMNRVPDVFDVWLESGIAPWASFGYPHRNRDLFEKVFPVDLINESQDQIRGWFNALLFAGMAAFDKPAYKSVAMMGWVVDDKGEKMSKSLGNVVYAREGIEKIGADALRLYYCWEIAPWDVQKFSFQTAKDIQRALTILWNTFQFYDTYRDADFKPLKLDRLVLQSLPPEDRWLLSRVSSVAEEVNKLLEKFEFHLAGRTLVKFVLEDFSRWYIKLVRDRTWINAEPAAKQQALTTMRYALSNLSKLLAPMTPFITEWIYQTLKKTSGGGGAEDAAGAAEESVHHCAYPKGDPAFIDSPLEQRMKAAMAITEASNAARQQAKVRLRWPVREILVSGESATQKAVAELKELLLRATNAKSIRFVEERDAPKQFVAVEFEGGRVFLNPARDEELVREALLRELIRAIQAARKTAGLSVREQISLAIATDKATEQKLGAAANELKAEVGAREIAFVQASGLKGEFEATLESEGFAVKAKFSKA
jgi:isoleucyl-tRNA synthetase